mmetsp:Transcript_27821/g.31249  ORF Transcript_27821/g.31249 Transcript_27821/m.31249 type:complete len:97 (+) Transcript_27821:427-717(+)
MDPIAAILTETITAVMSQMGTGIGGKEENEDGSHYRRGNKGRRLGIGSSSNTNDNFVDMFLTESISSMLSFNTLQQTFVDSVGGFSSDILNFDKLF